MTKALVTRAKGNVGSQVVRELRGRVCPFVPPCVIRTERLRSLATVSSWQSATSWIRHPYAALWRVWTISS